jgi:hypothetical protein
VVDLTYDRGGGEVPPSGLDGGPSQAAPAGHDWNEALPDEARQLLGLERSGSHTIKLKFLSVPQASITRHAPLVVELQIDADGGGAAAILSGSFEPVRSDRPVRSGVLDVDAYDGKSPGIFTTWQETIAGIRATGFRPVDDHMSPISAQGVFKIGNVALPAVMDLRAAPVVRLYLPRTQVWWVLD